MRRIGWMLALSLGVAAGAAGCGAVTPYSGPQTFGDGRSRGSA